MDTSTVHRPAWRFVILCDGTWEDALFEPNPDRYTNIRRIANALLPFDRRTGISQVKMYQPGVGTGEELYGALPPRHRWKWAEEWGQVGGVKAALGVGMVSNARNAYDWLASNYQEGDEVFLFGFSRGAYTARLIASLIGIIGIFPLSKLPEFPTILNCLCAPRGPTAKDQVNKQKLDALLDAHEPMRLAQMARIPSGFLVKAVCVFDTVGARGRPSELRRKPKTPVTYNSFGEPDQVLSTHIQYAYHALALDEFRVDYKPALFYKQPDADARGQELLQMWFSGCHADCGGGYKSHDLATISLFWMVAQTQKLLAYDDGYLKGLVRDSKAPYGACPPHQSRKGVFRLASIFERPPPVSVDPATQEYIHSSVRHQNTLRETVQIAIDDCPSLVPPLLPFEKYLRDFWPALTPSHATPGSSVRTAAELPVLESDSNDDGEESDFPAGGSHQDQNLAHRGIRQADSRARDWNDYEAEPADSRPEVHTDSETASSDSEQATRNPTWRERYIHARAAAKNARQDRREKLGGAGVAKDEAQGR